MLLKFSVLTFLLAAPAFAATPPPGAINIAGPGIAIVETPAELAGLPLARVNAAFVTDHGMLKAVFTGPLLWTLLNDTRAIDPAKPKNLVRDTIAVRGGDGYVAVLAMGEIAPFLEGKQVILATAINGKPLSPGNYRLIVPNDARGARSVKQVAGITVTTALQTLVP